jgi:hypothetical protein
MSTSDLTQTKPGCWHVEPTPVDAQINEIQFEDMLAKQIIKYSNSQSDICIII